MAITYDDQNTTNYSMPFYVGSRIPHEEYDPITHNYIPSGPYVGPVSMFTGCFRLKHINFGENFKTNKITDMSYMFQDCFSLEELDLSSFNTANVTDMVGMFQNCFSLEELDLSNFDTSNVTDMTDMFCCAGYREPVGKTSEYKTDEEETEYALPPLAQGIGYASNLEPVYN